MEQIILGLETATDSCSCALYTARNIYVRHQIAPQQHSNLILQMIDELLTEAKLKLSDITTIALGIGPGSFTGLRLAVSLAQGLGYGVQKSIIPISTLRALAQAAYRRWNKTQVLATLDAKMHELYVGFYKINNGVMEALSPDRLWSPLNRLDLPKDFNQDFVVVGTALPTYMEEISKHCGKVQFEPVLKYPSALDVVTLAAQSTLNSKLTPNEVTPIYIRNQVV